MAASVTGTFILIDRASGPLKRIAAQARLTDAAMADLGDRMDNTGTNSQIRQYEKVGRELRNVERQARSAGGEMDGMETATRGTTRAMGDATRVGGLLSRRMVLLGGAVAGLLPIIVQLTGALGALVGSLGQAIVGVGALATGLGGALAVGLAGVAGAAIPAMKHIKSLKDEFNSLKESWSNATAPGQKDFFGMITDSMAHFNKMMPMLADSSNRSMAAARKAVDLFFGRLDSASFGKFIERMTTSFERIAGPLASTFANIGETLGNIARASAPYVERMVQAFNGITANWAATTGNTAELRRSIGRMVSQAEDWMHLFGAIWDLTKAVFGSGADEGQGLVRDMTSRVKEYTDWVTRNPEKMNKFWRDGIAGTKELARFLGSLRLPLKNLNDAMKPIVRIFERLTATLAEIKLPGTDISGLTAAIAGYGALKFTGKMGIWGVRGPAAPGSAANPIATVGVGGGANSPGGVIPTGGARTPTTTRTPTGGMRGMLGKIPKAGWIGIALAALAATDAFKNTDGNFGNKLLNGGAAMDPAAMFEMLGMESPFTKVNSRTGLREVRKGIDFNNPLTLALAPLALGTLGLQGMLDLFDGGGGSKKPQATPEGRNPAGRVTRRADTYARITGRSLGPGGGGGGIMSGPIKETKEGAKEIEKGFGIARRAVGIESAKAEELARKHFERARKAMVDNSNKAGFEVKNSFARLAQQVYSQLTKFMSGPEASRAMKSVGIGAPPQGAGGGAGAGGRGGGNRAYGGRAYAGGGRIHGMGHRDTVPLMGMAAPGELIVNRHTEGRVNSMLGAFGTSLGGEVNRERVPHSAIPKEKNAALGMRVPNFRRGGRTGGGGMGGGSILAAGRLGSKMGLSVSGGPGYGGVPSTGHASNSLHYSGLAYDLSGSPAQMRAYFLAALRSFRSSINELFYDPMGYYIDGGRRVPGAIGDHSDHVHIGFNAGGASGRIRLGRGAMNPMVRLRAPRTALAGLPGAGAQRGMNLLAGNMAAAANRGRGRAAGPGQIMGASVFGGPGDPGTGTVGYRGDSLPGKMAFAELNMGTAMGGLPYRAPVRISLGNRSVVARKLDIGAGGGPVGGVPRAIDLWYETAQALGMHGGLAKVKVQRLAQGGRVPFGGWFGNGGRFTANKPTLIGVGENGAEDVQVTPKSKSSAGSASAQGVSIGTINIANHRKGDIKKQVKQELHQAFTELEREIRNDSGRGIV